VIRVVPRGELADSGADALMLSMGSDLEALTSVERDFGRGAGRETLARLRALGDLDVGGVVVTPAGDLPTDFLIHVVIRSVDEAVSEAGLRRAFRNGLRQAAEWGVETLAVPPLGTGAGNLNAEESARIMIEELRAHRLERLFPRHLVVLVGDSYEEGAFRGAAERLVPSHERPGPDPVPPET